MYPKAELLLKDIKEFVERVENGKIKSISKILRIKNGFENILNWKWSTDCEYVDIKINALFNNKDNINNASQIVEIQFLLNFLVVAKKIGHKFYAIKRKEMYIDSIDNLVYRNNNNYQNYATKIDTLIADNDLNTFSKQLFFQPNMIFSRIGLLITIGAAQKYRMYELFLNCLFHFGEILLNEKEPKDVCTIYNKDLNTIGKRFDWGGSLKKADKKCINDVYPKIDARNKLFVQKYLNFTHGGAPYIWSTDFV